MREISTETTIKQRVMQLCDYYGISPNKLSIDMKYNRNYVSRITNSIPFEMVLFIYRNYDSINLEWLITGNGKMLLPDTTEEQNLSTVIEMLDFSQKRNMKLEHEMQELKEKLNDVADIAKSEK